MTPKPHYAVDGNKAFGVTGNPPTLSEELERELGAFPFPQFWGPMAGLKSTAGAVLIGASLIAARMIGSGHFDAAKYPGDIGDAPIVCGDYDFAQGLGQAAPFDDVLEERLAGDGMERFAGEAGRGIAGWDDAECVHFSLSFDFKSFSSSERRMSSIRSCRFRKSFVIW